MVFGLMRDSKSARNLVRKPSIGQAAASPSAQMVLPPMPLAMLDESSTSPGLALAARQPLADARQPARALAAGGALAAGLVGVEPHDARAERDDAGAVVEHHDAARAGHGLQLAAAAQVEGTPGRTSTSLMRGSVIERLELARHVQLGGVERRHRAAARNHRLQLAPVGHAAADVVDELAEGDPHRQLEHARLVHVARDADEARAARLARAEAGEPLAPLGDDVRHAHERLDVVDDRRLREGALDGRERRLEPGPAALALQEFEQPGLLAADVRARAAVHVMSSLKPPPPTA